jgi:signal transduction histidine kinase
VRIADWIDRRMAGRQPTTLSVVGLALVLTVLSGAVMVAMWLRYGAIAEQRVRLDDVASVLAQHASRTVDSVDAVLGVLAERIASVATTGTPTAEDLRDLLRDHIAGQPHVRGMLFLDARGIGRGDSEAAPPRPIDASDREYFRHHRQPAGRGLFIDAPVFSRVSGVWRIVLSRRVQSAGGEFLGVVAAGIDPPIFTDIHRELAIGGTSVMSLLRGDGRLMARHPSVERGLGEPVALGELVDERRFVSASRTVDRYPLTVVISMPIKAALVSWERQVTVIAIATVSALLALVLVGFVLIDQSRRLESTVAALALARDEAVQARLREEDAGRAKSAFLANTSHELRTPLNAILGFSEVLRDGHVGALEPKQRGYAASIHDAGTHLLGLISDLLDMAKIEARELQLRESVVDMADIVADGVKLTASRAAERGVVVVSRVEGESIRIRGDAQRLRQIVLNLMSNAIKFTAAGGRVWIEASIDAGGRPTLIVSDSGIGMSQEEVQVALTPFRQVESPFTREHEGTGLGLPIVMALAELHGGYLKVESERGVGTRVIVSLPGARLVMGPVSALKAAAG